MFSTSKPEERSYDKDEHEPIKIYGIGDDGHETFFGIGDDFSSKSCILFCYIVTHLADYERGMV